MKLLMKLHQLITKGCDGLRSDFFDLFARTTSSDTMVPPPPALTVGQPATDEASKGAEASEDPAPQPSHLTA